MQISLKSEFNIEISARFFLTYYFINTDKMLLFLLLVNHFA